MRDIAVGEPFVMDWELFVSANRWGDSVPPTVLSLTCLLGMACVPGILTFRREVVPPPLPTVEGLPALVGDAITCAVVGGTVEGSSIASAGGNSPVYYPTGGDPNTHAAHAVHSSASVDAGDGDTFDDLMDEENDPRTLRLRMPFGFVRSERATNWLVAWDEMWGVIDAENGGVPTAEQKMFLSKCKKQEQELYKRFLRKMRKQEQKGEVSASKKRSADCDADPPAFTGRTKSRISFASPSSARHGSGPSVSAKRVRSSPRLVAANSSSVLDVAQRAHGQTVGAKSHADLLRGSGSALSVTALRARYESALQESHAAEEGLLAAARCTDNAVEAATLVYTQALVRVADVYQAALRSARRGYTSAVEANTIAQGSLLDARDRLLAAWDAEDPDAGCQSEDSDEDASEDQED